MLARAWEWECHHPWAWVARDSLGLKDHGQAVLVKGFVLFLWWAISALHSCCSHQLYTCACTRLVSRSYYHPLSHPRQQPRAPLTIRLIPAVQPPPGHSMGNAQPAMPPRPPVFAAGAYPGHGVGGPPPAYVQVEDLAPRVAPTLDDAYWCHPSYPAVGSPRPPYPLLSRFSVVRNRPAPNFEECRTLGRHHRTCLRWPVREAPPSHLPHMAAPLRALRQSILWPPHPRVWPGANRRISGLCIRGTRTSHWYVAFVASDSLSCLETQ